MMIKPLNAIKKMVYAKFLYAWYHYPWVFILLLPFAAIYRIIIALRHLCYKKNWLKSYRAPVKVIVVGNLVVGGTGKTPMVIWLAQMLKASGFNPGIITRGYGGQANNIMVTAQTDVQIAGDEPLLIAQKTHCLVMKNKNRSLAAQDLSTQCDVIISDDGLQHYALDRDIEIVMMPDEKFLKNPFSLPAGPWREPKNRLKNANFIVTADQMQIKIKNLAELNAFMGRTVHAVCAIAMPWRFFSLLNEVGIKTINHVYPDHAVLSANDLTFDDDLPILITEKDAVKLKNVQQNNIFIVTIEADFPEKLKSEILIKLKGK
jgi:tetraacyldisaccharide 4'-kinase